MNDNKFGDLEQAKFERKMRPYITAQLNELYPNRKCMWVDDNEYHRWLDINAGIDGTLFTSNIDQIRFQSKVRDYDLMVNPKKQKKAGYPDFTIETKNGDGTPGEWKHLYADYYIYSWANEAETELAAWVLVDIAKMRYIIEEENGGIHNIGDEIQNQEYGSSWFRAFPLWKIAPAIRAHAGLPDGWDTM